jgi:hypothetical protein
MRNVFLILIFLNLQLGCSSEQKSQVTSPSPAVKSPQTPPAKAEEKVKTINDDIACKLGSETRTLKIESSQPKGCKLFYSTFNEKEPVAWSHLGPTHCNQVRDRIQAKLEDGGFKCGNK